MNPALAAMNYTQEQINLAFQVEAAQWKSDHGRGIHWVRLLRDVFKYQELLLIAFNGNVSEARNLVEAVREQQRFSIDHGLKHDYREDYA